MDSIFKTFMMSTLSNAEKPNEGPRSNSGGIVRSVNFTSVAEQNASAMKRDECMFGFTNHEC